MKNIFKECWIFFKFKIHKEKGIKPEMLRFAVDAKIFKPIRFYIYKKKLV
jgi:hypothetical protein